MNPICLPKGTVVADAERGEADFNDQSNDAVAQRDTSALLNLPGELRNEIYGFALIVDAVIDLRSIAGPLYLTYGLFLTSRQVREESIPIWSAHKRFKITTTPRTSLRLHPRYLLHRSTPAGFKHTQDLTLRFLLKREARNSWTRGDPVLFSRGLHVVDLNLHILGSTCSVSVKGPDYGEWTRLRKEMITTDENVAKAKADPKIKKDALAMVALLERVLERKLTVVFS